MVPEGNDGHIMVSFTTLFENKRNVDASFIQ